MDSVGLHADRAGEKTPEEFCEGDQKVQEQDDPEDLLDLPSRIFVVIGLAHDVPDFTMKRRPDSTTGRSGLSKSLNFDPIF
jgi:hypothetical protein